MSDSLTNRMLRGDIGNIGDASSRGRVTEHPVTRAIDRPTDRPTERASEREQQNEALRRRSSDSGRAKTSVE